MVPVGQVLSRNKSVSIDNNFNENDKNPLNDDKLRKTYLNSNYEAKDQGKGMPPFYLT